MKLMDMLENAKLEEDVHKFTKEQEEVTGARQKLAKLNTLRGKLSAKVSAITKSISSLWKYGMPYLHSRD